MRIQLRRATRGWHFRNKVAKLAKSFVGLCSAAESLDDFRYRKACFQQRKMLHRVPFWIVCLVTAPWQFEVPHQ